jgi:DNA-nicking Smr family endonuclease
MNDEGEPVRIPIDGVLDLHPFSPKDVKSVIEEYLNACLEEGISDLRIIHGKGKGHLRRTTHALLSRHPQVLDFKLDSGPSGWGATLVRLKPSS